jgi:hypothetical protein
MYFWSTKCINKKFNQLKFNRKQNNNTKLNIYAQVPFKSNMKSSQQHSDDGMKKRRLKQSQRLVAKDSITQSN